jgi:hypothetical protein
MISFFVDLLTRVINSGFVNSATPFRREVVNLIQIVRHVPVELDPTFFSV